MKGKSEKSGEIFFYLSYSRDQKERIIVRTKEVCAYDVYSISIDKDAYNKIMNDIEKILREMKEEGSEYQLE